MGSAAFRALFTSVASTPLERVVLRLAGGSPVAFLHDTSTQDVAGLRPGAGALTCFLNEKGRVQAEARALMLEDGTIMLDAEPAARGYLTGWLARIAPLSGCEITDESDAWHVTAVRGPDAATALGIGEPFADEHDHVLRDGERIVRVDWGPPGFDVISRAPMRVGIDADAEAFEAARIAAGRPRFGIDVTEDSFINETPLLAHAVAPAKGCYPGQESVARVQNLGRIRRHLVGIDFAEAIDLAAGAAVLGPEGDAGAVTSAARTDAGAAAIAYVRSEVSGGTVVEVADARGTVRALG